MKLSDDPLLGDYLQEWLERRRSQLRPTTLRCYRQAVDSYVVPHLGDSRLSQLDRVLLEDVYADLLEAGGLHGKPLSVRTVRLAHKVLHRALRDAVLDGLVQRNPAELARVPRRDPEEVEVDDELQVWTAAQVVRFLELVDDHPLRALWHLAIGTETSCVRTLSVTASVIDALQRRRDQQAADRAAAGTAFDDADRWGLVFTDQTGAPVPPMEVTMECRRLVRDLDVPVIRLHDLRHTHATLLLARGVPIKVVSERLGHSTIAMTMDTYAHTMPAMDRDAADRFDAELEARLEGVDVAVG